MEGTGTTTGANVESVTLGTPATADSLTPPVSDGFSRIDPTVDNVSDVDGYPAKVEETKPAPTEAEVAKAAEEKAAKEAEAKAAAEKADLERFDKHPRFQELRAERDAMKAELAQIKESLKVLTPQQKEAAQVREEKELPYKDITKMSKAEILEWQEDDPVGYAANLYQQMLHEARETLNREKAVETQKTSVKSVYEQYGKANPDFMKLWEAGEIQKVMDSNPILFPNAISAHMAMKLKGAKGYIDKVLKEAADKAAKEKEEAIKEAVDRVTKNFQAKRNAEVISDGGSIKTEGTSDELKHPDKYGGTTSVLASRLSRLRQAAAGG